VLETAWFGWFLAEPLPNAGNVGGKEVRHWLFLANALPHVVPGVTFRESYLGRALVELGHFENLPQRISLVVVSLEVGGAAVGLGLLLIRALGLHRALTRTERFGLAYGLGTTALGDVTLLAGRLGLLAPWPVRYALGVPILAAALLAVLDRRHADDPDPKPPQDPADRWAWLERLGLVVVVTPFLVTMALGAMLPTIDYDALEYHLQGPKEYYQAGRIGFLPHNVYTSMPFSVEMLHLLAMYVLGDWWAGALSGQVLVAAFAPAAAALIGVTAARLGSPRAGRIAAVVYLTTPWIYRLGVLPYVEGPLCYYHAALVWAATRAWGEGDRVLRTRLWVVVGLLAGGAMACKYPGLISAVIPFGALALADAVRRRSWPTVAAFALGWLVVIGPWLAKNVIDTGNPVYPLAYRVFGGLGWDEQREAKWTNAHGPRSISLRLLGDSIVDVAGRSDWQSPLYAALAPLALLRPGSRRGAWAIWGYVLYLFATWWLLTHRLDRFWLPLLGPLAVLAGLGADWVRNTAWSVLLATILGLAVLTNLSYASTALTGLNDWTANLIALRGEVPLMLNRPLARLDTELPPGAKVLLVGQAAVFHLYHPIVYNTVFDHEIIETLTRGRTPEQIRRSLAELGVTHVYVDWFEIERYRSPGNYGFTSYVTPELFTELVASGVLQGPEALGERQQLYTVRKGRGGG
jgi:hypothetical protein